MGLVHCLMGLEGGCKSTPNSKSPQVRWKRWNRSLRSLRIGFIRQWTRHIHAYDDLGEFISNLCLVRSEFALNSCLAKDEFTWLMLRQRRVYWELVPSRRRASVNSCLAKTSFCKLVSNNKRVDHKLVLNKKQVQFKLLPKIHVYRTIADPKSRVEIVCAEQVVGVYVRQVVMILRNVLACTASGKLVAEGRPSKHEDMMVAAACLWLNDRWLTKSMIMIRSI